MSLIKKKIGGNLRAYAWVAELQERGAVHYHVILLLNRGTALPKPDKAGWWTYGSTKVQTVNSAFYIAKYTGKEHQKEGVFPKGMRMFAVWVPDGVVDASALWNHKLTSLPGWLVAIILSIPNSEGGAWRRQPGGGWIFEDQIFQSPYAFLGME